MKFIKYKSEMLDQIEGNRFNDASDAKWRQLISIATQCGVLSHHGTILAILVLIKVNNVGFVYALISVHAKTYIYRMLRIMRLLMARYAYVHQLTSFAAININNRDRERWMSILGFKKFKDEVYLKGV